MNSRPRKLPESCPVCDGPRVIPGKHKTDHGDRFCSADCARRHFGVEFPAKTMHMYHERTQRIARHASREEQAEAKRQWRALNPGREAAASARYRARRRAAA